MSERVHFPNGELRVEDLAAAFGALPADVTYIDAGNVVRYYSSYRIFSRTPECLDRDVLLCHSAETRPSVARMLSEFASGWRDEARFVERKSGQLVDVRYIAVRDAGGTYLGCLEVARWADRESA